MFPYIKCSIAAFELEDFHLFPYINSSIAAFELEDFPLFPYIKSSIAAFELEDFPLFPYTKSNNAAFNPISIWIPISCTLTNSENPEDKIPHKTAFHQGLHCFLDQKIFRDRNILKKGRNFDLCPETHLNAKWTHLIKSMLSVSLCVGCIH